ncbi:hypothetical protein KPH14_009861 [Odynerus spinipes]|uniref:Uncharacterized protein n=1 Tax=Odynerus spinipes TaxID=1348599 RepID=A0AAD9RW26_9HYME|nr:hypothetical protein KPH14_009861 [Odynerus spinipes]
MEEGKEGEEGEEGEVKVEVTFVVVDENARRLSACARSVATAADAFLNETVAVVSSHQGVHPRFALSRILFSHGPNHGYRVISPWDKLLLFLSETELSGEIRRERQKTGGRNKFIEFWSAFFGDIVTSPRSSIFTPLSHSTSSFGSEFLIRRG